jgi:hypothetical protein
MTKLLTAMAFAGIATVAYAQTEFYIVQDTTTKRCSVVREKPTTKTTVIVSPAGTVYKTEAEARTALKTVKVCETK